MVRLYMYSPILHAMGESVILYSHSLQSLHKGITISSSLHVETLKLIVSDVLQCAIDRACLNHVIQAN